VSRGKSLTASCKVCDLDKRKNRNVF